MTRPPGQHTSEPSLSEVAWDEHGLAPAVVCDAETGAVLMLGWMNAEALATTRATGLVHFFSRSRGRLWKKGETSGNTLTVREVRHDCDGDALLVTAVPAGPTCHTGKRSCFFARAEPDRTGWAVDDGPTGAPAAVVDRLFATMQTRREVPTDKSYTAALLAGGVDRIAAKIDEETQELIDELRQGGAAALVAHEAADLVYHLLVGLLAAGVAPTQVWTELSRRFGQSGHDEKAARR